MTASTGRRPIKGRRGVTHKLTHIGLRSAPRKGRGWVRNNPSANRLRLRLVVRQFDCDTERRVFEESLRQPPDYKQRLLQPAPFCGSMLVPRPTPRRHRQGSEGRRALLGDAAETNIGPWCPYSFLAVLPLVKQIASLCVPPQREEICIGMSSEGSASAPSTGGTPRRRSGTLPPAHGILPRDLAVSNIPGGSAPLHDPPQLARPCRWPPAMLARAVRGRQ